MPENCTPEIRKEEIFPQPGYRYIGKIPGPPQFFSTEKERQDEVGVATAIAWTENGGEIMPVETLTVEGKGNLQITGQIGDIMQESAQAGLSYLKSRSRALGLDPDAFEHLDVHIHIPEGAIPKDGPIGRNYDCNGFDFCFLLSAKLTGTSP